MPSYTTAAQVLAVVGSLGLELRTDDVDDYSAHIEEAIGVATDDLDFYLQKYSQTDIAASTWAQRHATWFAVRWLCIHRLNDVPESVTKECERREKQLELIRQGKAVAPRLANSRRPGAVTGYVMQNRRWNNQVRVDKNNSTGKAEGYRRPTDPTSPDSR